VISEDSGSSAANDVRTSDSGTSRHLSAFWILGIAIVAVAIGFVAGRLFPWSASPIRSTPSPSQSASVSALNPADPFLTPYVQEAIDVPPVEIPSLEVSPDSWRLVGEAGSSEGDGYRVFGGLDRRGRACAVVVKQPDTPVSTQCFDEADWVDGGFTFSWFDKNLGEITFLWSKDSGSAMYMALEHSD
jgi:hypothetical protein